MSSIRLNPRSVLFGFASFSAVISRSIEVFKHHNPEIKKCKKCNFVPLYILLLIPKIKYLVEVMIIFRQARWVLSTCCKVQRDTAISTK